MREIRTSGLMSGGLETRSREPNCRHGAKATERPPDPKAGAPAPDPTAFNYAERALAYMTKRDKLNEFMRSLDATQWQNVVLNICNLGDQFYPEHVEPGIVVLLNQWSDMSEQS